MNCSQRSCALGPEKGTGPNAVAAVSCSERWSRGLPLAISVSGVSKLGGSRRTEWPAVASEAILLLQKYHQAMSCGFTNETVVHQGPALPSLESHSSNCFAMRGSTRCPWPGAPSGDGKVPPENP